jgi:RNA polymerase sigma-70 factor (ECF subfamily)
MRSSGRQRAHPGDPGDEFDSAITSVVEDGRINREYAMRNPHELGRLDTVAELRR